MHLYVDASYLANSAANGLPPEQLAYGPPAIALDIVAKIAQFIRTYGATRTYFCLDPKGGSWRKQICPTYKAHREEKLAKDPARKLAHDMATTTVQDVLPELVSLMGCPNFVYPWLEADDMVAAAVALNRGKPGIMITADNDYLQLVDQNICMVDPIHSLRYAPGPDGKILRYKGDGTVEQTGLDPAECLLAKAIQGDTSDNLPGLIGVGEVTATKAVQEKRVQQLLVEETGMVTPRKSKNNPAPVPVQQDARAVVAFNLTMMDLLNSKVHPKVREIVAGMEAKAIRQPEAHFTKAALWLEEKHKFSREQAEATARQLCSTFRNQWLA
jgi:5'-3' exonuclease